MNELTPNAQLRIQYWLDIIHQCRESGQSNSQWCAENGISIKSYYYWLAKIRKMAVAELPRKKHAFCQTESAVSFAEISKIPLVPDRLVPNAPVIIRTGALTIELHPGADASLVRSVIEAVLSC